MSPEELSSQQTEMPSLVSRVMAFAHHGGRILRHRFPGYTFDDLAACQDALDGPAFQKVARRMWADPTGQRLMEERPRISLTTVDWRALSMMPIESLGYNLWHHFYDNGILHDVPLGEPIVRWDPETEYAKWRYRETHDIRHVLVGLGVEGYEEVILQTFQCAQQFQVLSAGIVIGGGLKHAIIDHRVLELVRNIPRAWRLGRRTRFLSNVYYEELWETPLEVVRQRLEITPIGDAYPVKQRHPDAPGQPQQVASGEKVNKNG
ncbi:MAG: ubiquinone biosynthesis protein COQ4 [Myxococcota bacterium]|jgi:ubiquinone biosynthesis protein COQ4